MKINTQKNIVIRLYSEADASSLAAIYFNTIHNINSKDYSSEQINAWAPVSSLEIDAWMRKWQKLIPIVATIDNKVVGFAELESNGHIDCFYCHHEYQGCGIGSALINEVEEKARKNKLNKIFAEVSITARSFFEAKGFTVKKQQLVVIRDIELTNFVMEKLL